MMTIIRSIESSVRNFVRSLRQSPRHSPRLPLKLTMIDAHAPQGTVPRLTLSGFTRNISATGLALIVPEIKLGERHLVGDNRTLLVVIELPTGPVKLHAQPIRYERLKHGALAGQYLIGARILGIDDASRVRMGRYLHRLSRQAELGQKLARTA
ncbi:MAG: PilZ domain-containing protein [Pyrinomonadaceae bacterium]